MSQMRKSRGFTLIEVLIVVVIIGVLASLIVPRMVTAPEKAIVAEANQMVGSMIRAQVSNIDLGAAFVSITTTSTAGDWNKLGMKPPTNAKFAYTCSSDACTATKTVGSVSSTVKLDTAGAWTCGGSYTKMTNGGCTLS